MSDNKVISLPELYRQLQQLKLAYEDIAQCLCDEDRGAAMLKLTNEKLDAFYMQFLFNFHESVFVNEDNALEAAA